MISTLPPIRNLKPARTLALDDDLAVLRAQFNLANVTASSIDLLRDQRRALEAASRFAPRNVFAAVGANGCRRGVEVRLKHASNGSISAVWRAAVKRTTLPRRGIVYATRQ